MLDFAKSKNMIKKEEIEMSELDLTTLDKNIVSKEEDLKKVN